MFPSDQVAGSPCARRGLSSVSLVAGQPVRASERVDVLPQSGFVAFQPFGSASSGGELDRDALGRYCFLHVATLSTPALNLNLERGAAQEDALIGTIMPRPGPALAVSAVICSEISASRGLLLQNSGTPAVPSGREQRRCWLVTDYSSLFFYRVHAHLWQIIHLLRV
jgi:hypothetical protein